MDVTKNIEFNLNYWFYLASDSNYSEGICWYKNAHDFICKISEQYPYSVMQLCAVTARLSPNIRWEVNKKALVCLLTDKTVPAFVRNVEIAKKYLDNQLSLDECLGDGYKVKNFFWNLYEPENEYYVTLDRWMFRVLNCPLPTIHRNNHFFTKKDYVLFKKEVINYSLNKFLIPNQLQAILWLVAKDYDLSIQKRGSLSLLEYVRQSDVGL